MSASLAALLHTYLDAKLALTEANNVAGEPDRKLGVIHKGQMYLVQMNKDGIAGMAVGPLSDGAVPEGTEPAPPVEAPKKRKAKAETIAGPGSTMPVIEAQVETATPPPAEAPKPAAPTWTKDKYRAYAREIAATVGIEAVKKVHDQRAIDTIPAEEFPTLADKLAALKKETL